MPAYHKTMEDTKVIKGFGVLYRTFLSYMSQSVKGMDISYSDSVFLVNIGDKEGISQEEISDSLSIDKAAVARSVKKMIKKGYVTTETSKADKRLKKLYLTDEGANIYSEILKLNAFWLDNVMSGLSDSEKTNFQNVIEQVSKKAKNLSKML